MKKLILIALALSASVFAANKAEAYYVFPANVQCQVNPAQASCTVENHLPYWVQCWGRVEAQTASGMFLWANANMSLAPGAYQYVYVYSNNPYDPIVGARANIQCRAY